MSPTDVTNASQVPRPWAVEVSHPLAKAVIAAHSLRQTKATLIYSRSGDLRGHTKTESTVQYLGIEVDDALALAEQVDV